MTGREDVSPSISGEIEGVLHPIFSRVVGRSIYYLRRINLAGGRKVRTVVDKRTRYYVELAIVIEVGGGGRPAVIELVDALHPEVFAKLLFRPRLHREIFVGDGTKVDGRPSPHLERNRAVSIHVFCGGADCIASIIEKSTDNVRVEQNLNIVPFVLAESLLGAVDWHSDAAGHWRQLRPAKCAGRSARGRGWRCKTDLATRDSELIAP